MDIVEIDFDIFSSKNELHFPQSQETVMRIYVSSLCERHPKCPSAAGGEESEESSYTLEVTICDLKFCISFIRFNKSLFHGANLFRSVD